MLCYRDDDVRTGIPGGVFEGIHDIFRHYKKVHTLSVVCRGISEIDPWVRMVQENPEEFDIAFHGWEHEHYTIMPEEVVRTEIETSLKLLDSLFGKKPTVWYLPWNGWVVGNADKVGWLRPIAKEYGLSIKIQCSYIKDFLAGKHKPVVYFHWWDEKDVALLPELLSYEK